MIIERRCTKREIKKIADYFPELSKEWDYEKNIGLKFEEITIGSNKRVWWVCSKCGYEWKTSINHRTGNKPTSCPKCSKIIGAKNKSLTAAKTNNFAEKHPELICEWHPTKNGDVKVEDISESCNYQFWWLCSYCGNEWQSTVNHRANGRGCPKCSKSQTSFPEKAIYFYLKKAFPDTINRYKDQYELDIYIPSEKTAVEYDGYYFHKSKSSLIKDNKKDNYCCENGIKLIRFRSPRLADTEKSIRITCEDYQIGDGIKELFEILNYKKMPDINIKRDTVEIKETFRQTESEKSIAVKFPAIVEEWHTTKNGGIMPTSVYAYSNLNYWWKCKKCGYEYQTSPNHRSNGGGCPVCAGKKALVGYNDLKTLCPDVAEEWNYEKNYPLLPEQFVKRSNKIVWWKCLKYGHEWKTKITERTREDQQTGCPYCANKKVLTGFNDLATTHPHLLNQWDYELNDLKPTEITYGCKKEAHWICDICGNKWKAYVYSRASGTGCPVCGRKKAGISRKITCSELKKEKMMKEG